MLPPPVVPGVGVAPPVPEVDVPLGTAVVGSVDVVASPVLAGVGTAPPSLEVVTAAGIVSSLALDESPPQPAISPPPAPSASTASRLATRALEVEGVNGIPSTGSS